MLDRSAAPRPSAPSGGRAPEQSGLFEDPAGLVVARLTEYARREVPEGDGARSSTSPAGGGQGVARAAEDVRRRVDGGATPIGLYRLSEILAPVLTGGGAGVPAQRVPATASAGVGALVNVVRGCPCALLDAPTPADVAEHLAAVLADGRRVLVTGPDPAALAAVRAAMPAPLSGLCLDGPPPLSITELRELRATLVTGPARSRPRIDRTLPSPEQVPTLERVAQLCQAAGGRGRAPRDGLDLLPELLGRLDPMRLNALMTTAHRCQDTVASVDPHGESGWAMALLQRVLFDDDRADFEDLLRRTTDVVLAADLLRDAGDQMAVIGTLPPGAVEQLRDYVNYLDTGGRSRVYFRSPEQRAAQPVLRHLRLDGVPLSDTTVLHQALAFVELIGAMDEIGELCWRLGVPEPTNVPGVAELNRQLDRVEEAARAAEHLRHEVLFIHPDSPVTMPDLATTGQVARTIVATGGASAMDRARRQLHALADELDRAAVSVSGAATGGPADRRPEDERAPEFAALAAALRHRSLPAYSEALDYLAANRREQSDQRRRAELLGRLRAGAPGLAALWEQSGRFTPGTAQFVGLDELLSELPGEDHADLVLLLGVGSLGPEYLLVSAAAPRLLAVGSGFASTPLPAPAGPDAREGALTLLRRAGVPVVAAGRAAASAPAPMARPTAPAAGPLRRPAEETPPARAAEPVRRFEPVRAAEPTRREEPTRPVEPVRAAEPVARPAEETAPARPVEPVWRPAEETAPVPAAATVAPVGPLSRSLFTPTVAPGPVAEMHAPPAGVTEVPAPPLTDAAPPEPEPPAEVLEPLPPLPRQFSVPAQRESPSVESTDSDSGDGGEFVVLPLGVVRRKKADAASEHDAMDQRAGA